MLGRILIAGAGAIGSVIGGFLRQGGEEVALLGREDHIRAVREKGLEIEGLWGDHRVEGFKLAADPGELKGDFDLILITVKSYDTEAVLRQVASRLRPDGLVASMQNGLGNLEKVAEVFGKEKTLGVRVIFGAELRSPGRVRVTVYADRLMAGGFNREISRRLRGRIENIVAALDQAGVPAGYADEIQPFLWAKILYNCPLNPLGALMRVDYGSLADSGEIRVVMNEIIKEIFSVARAEGVSLFWDQPEAYQQEFYQKLLPPTRTHRASMISDLERGKPTEIEAMNGWIARLGKKHGIPTPYNETLTRMIRFQAGLSTV